MYTHIIDMYTCYLIQVREPEMFKELASAGATSMVHKMDHEISQALTNFLGRCWTEDDVKSRCQIIRDGHGVETFCVDGEPLLEMHPVESSIEYTQDSVIVRYTRKFRRLTLRR